MGILFTIGRDNPQTDIINTVIEDGSMQLTSPDFDQNQPIPAKFTCDGDDVNPNLNISGVPDGTKSLALIVDDPDAPAGSANPGWVHWLVANIPPSTTTIAQNSVPDGAVQMQNDFKQTAYGGPCPPAGIHRYFFRLYALNSELNLPAESGKSQLLNAMKGHILGQAELIGTYQR